MSHDMELRRMYSPWGCLHLVTHYESKNLLSHDDVCWCWKLMSCSIHPWKIACSSHLRLNFSKDAPLQNLVVIGHAHGLEEAWLLVSVGHLDHSLALALRSNLNSNGFLYPIPSPPTQPWCTLLKDFLSCRLHILFIRHFFSSKIQKESETC